MTASDGGGPATPRTVAVLGHYHGRNLGDDLVVATVFAALRRRLPGALLLAVSLDPADSEGRHGVEAFPIKPSRRGGGGLQAVAAPVRESRLKAFARRVPGARRLRLAVALGGQAARELPFLLRARRLLAGVDEVVVPGSGQLDDSRSGWSHAYAIFRWTTLARLTRTRFVLLSVGAGPIDRRLGAIMIRRAVESSSFISVRDPASATVLRAIGVRRDLPVRPDMAYGYVLPAGRLQEHRAGTRVGVNVMGHQDSRYEPGGDRRRYDAYLAKMAQFVAGLVAEGVEIVLFSSQTTSDALVLDDLVAALEARGAWGEAVRGSVVLDADADGLVRTIGSCDYVVAARFHCVLLALALGIPAVALAYHDKLWALLEESGHAEWALDIDAFTPDELAATFAAVRSADGPDLRDRLLAVAAERRAEVEAQFDEVFRQAPATSAGRRREGVP